MPLRAVADPREAGAIDLALVCVKSFDTGAAGRALAPALVPGAVVLSLQNGVENPAALARACPEAAVGGVAVYLGCQRLAPDHVVRRPSRDPSTGRLRDLLAGGGAGAPGGALAAVGAAIGVPVRVDDDPALALWSKLVANVALNTVTALGRARVGPVLADPHAVGLMLALGREVVAVAHAAGVQVAPDAAEAYVADARRRLPAGGGSSTLFDLENGRRLERDALVGAVVAPGRAAGRRGPGQPGVRRPAAAAGPPGTLGLSLRVRRRDAARGSRGRRGWPRPASPPPSRGRRGRARRAPRRAPRCSSPGRRRGR